MASDKVVNADDSDFEEVISSGITLVDFWAPWCGPCKMLAPLVDKVAARVEGKASVAKVNVDEAGISAEKYGISNIPTLIIFKDGVEVERLSGAAQREDDLVKRIEGQL